MDLRSIKFRFEKVFTLVYIDLSSHSSVHIQIAFDLESQIDPDSLSEGAHTRLDRSHTRLDQSQFVFQRSHSHSDRF